MLGPPSTPTRQTHSHPLKYLYTQYLSTYILPSNPSSTPSSFDPQTFRRKLDKEIGSTPYFEDQSYYWLTPGYYTLPTETDTSSSDDDHDDVVGASSSRNTQMQRAMSSVGSTPVSIGRQGGNGDGLNGGRSVHGVEGGEARESELVWMERMKEVEGDVKVESPIRLHPALERGLKMQEEEAGRKSKIFMRQSLPNLDFEYDEDDAEDDDVAVGDGEYRMIDHVENSRPVELIGSASDYQKEEDSNRDQVSHADSNLHSRPQSPLQTTPQCTPPTKSPICELPQPQNAPPSSDADSSEYLSLSDDDRDSNIQEDLPDALNEPDMKTEEEALDELIEDSTMDVPTSISTQDEVDYPDLVDRLPPHDEISVPHPDIGVNRPEEKREVKTQEEDEEWGFQTIAPSNITTKFDSNLSKDTTQKLESSQQNRSPPTTRIPAAKPKLASYLQTLFSKSQSPPTHSDSENASDEAEEASTDSSSVAGTEGSGDSLSSSDSDSEVAASEDEDEYESDFIDDGDVEQEEEEEEKVPTEVRKMFRRMSLAAGGRRVSVLGSDDRRRSRGRKSVSKVDSEEDGDGEDSPVRVRKARRRFVIEDSEDEDEEDVGVREGGGTRLSFARESGDVGTSGDMKKWRNVVSSDSEDKEERVVSTASPAPVFLDGKENKVVVDEEWGSSGPISNTKTILGTPIKSLTKSIWSPDEKALGTPKMPSALLTPATGRIKRGMSPFQTPLQTPSKLAFARRREGLTRELYKDFNQRVFGGKLGDDMEVFWSVKLNKTAGRTYTFRTGSGEWVNTARIELSTKVVDDLEKLRNTLMHEMCHAAAWLVNKVCKPPHGDVFKYWGFRAMEVYPDVEVTTCHSYEINYKYTYVCTNDLCGNSYGRHSRSINTDQSGCGKCKSRLTLVEPARVKKDGTPYKENRYNLFVKEHFKTVKAENPDWDNGTVLKSLAARFKGLGVTD
ncbi:hypothetical protein HK097_011168 [Rhizophlyctis rosea]|uniref:SprT-like domain-containing protein n=1 Tax=Rhizophlyctis rosea TaxID=64517 RepID=A0AAD5X9A3_9FUNG|nr:hypothetical protein HK097_011168 [Rhizophlyctis rosea]